MGKVTKITIEIDTSNASFEDDFENEVLAVLSQVKVIDGWRLGDTNGNTVGEVKVETE